MNSRSYDKDEIAGRMEGRWLDFYEGYIGSIEHDNGKWYRARCPIHNGGDANFKCNAETGNWTCFSNSCGGGDAFSFLQKLQSLTFPEALERVAAFAQVDPTLGVGTSRKPATTPPSAKGCGLPHVNDIEAANCHTALLADGAMLTHLAECRGISREAAVKYQLGVHCAEKDEGYKRLTIPVYDADGRLVNIRRHLLAYLPELTDEKRKKLNKVKSWPTGTGWPLPLFPASSMDADTLLLVEGECDSIVGNSHYGIPTVSRTRGATVNWNNEDANAFRGKSVTILFDSDEAGRNGARKAAEALSGVARFVSIASYGVNGLDLSSFWLKGGSRKELDAMISSAEPLTSVDDENEGWDVPIGFGEPNLPDFPIDCLPKRIRAQVVDVAKTVGIPIDVPALWGLVAVASSLTHLVDIDLETHRETMCLYAISVLDSGSRKSEVLRRMCAPIFNVQKELQRRQEPEIQAARIQNDEIERQIKVVRGKLSSSHGEELQEDAFGRIAELQLAKAALPSPVRLVVDDITPETFGRKLEQQRTQSLSLFSAEGGIFGTMAGRYANGMPNLDLFLKAHNGDYWSADLGEFTVQIERPMLNMGLSVQPHVLNEMRTNAAFRDRGLLARFLYAYPQVKGPFLYSTEPINEEVADDYAALIRDNYFTPSPATKAEPGERHHLRLNAQGKYLWAKFYNEIAVRKERGGDLENVGDWSAKLPGVVARLAAIFHMVEYHGDGIGRQIGEKHVEAAIKIATWAIPHAQYALGKPSRSQYDTDARRVLKWICDTIDAGGGMLAHRGISTRNFLSVKTPVFSIRECYRCLASLGKEGVLSAIPILCDMCFIRPKELEREHGQRGRKPSPDYEIHPVLFGMSGRREFI